MRKALESLFYWIARNRRALTIAALYVACILAADLLAARWIVSLPFGLAVPAGVFAVAPVFTAPSDPAVLTFTLVVTDSLGLADPTPDEVAVTVIEYYVYLPLVSR